MLPAHCGEPVPSHPYLSRLWLSKPSSPNESYCSGTHRPAFFFDGSRQATLYTGGSGGFVASTAAPIATGWSDPVPGRAFHPAVVQRLFTAHCFANDRG